MMNRKTEGQRVKMSIYYGGKCYTLFKEFDSVKKSGCHGNLMEYFKQFFKNIFFCNPSSKFEIISQRCCLGNPFQKTVREILIRQ